MRLLMVFLLTVEHSGTRYVWSRFNWPRLCYLKDHELWKPESEWLFSHLYSSSMALIRTLCERVRPTVTERSVEAIRASWLRRGKDLSALDEQLANYDEVVSAYRPDIIKLGGGWDHLPDEIRMHV
jgi:hypothetical protein